ncbi:MAG: hypothetical protein R3352_07980, partial [Salinisphaeraceae bacterium]|nr:hypothetical protein [Salinisphaeraceae bacterium]
KPRIVLAANARPPASDYALDPLFKGRLFLGFVEAAEEIEIISYNEHAGRFEFQLVKDYAEGKTPKLVYAKRAICTTCHAGNGPIFPTRPWQETTAQPANTDNIIKARGTEKPYFGAPVNNKLVDAENFDGLTDIGNIVPVTQRVWLDGCGAKGDDCRKQMLRLALRYLWDAGSFSDSSPEAQTLRTLQSRDWPKQGIPMDNGDILNRNPFMERAFEFAPGRWFKSLFASSDDGEFADFENLPPLSAELDPLTPRKPHKMIQSSDLDGVYGVAQMFTPNDRRLLEQHTDYDFDEVLEALEHPRMQEFYAAQPVRRVAIMRALLASLGKDAPPEYCCLNTAGMSPPTVDGAPPLALSEDSPLQPYQRYCFGCHRGNPAAKLDFMNGETEAEVLARIKEVPEIRDALDYERYLGTDKEAILMPPRNSYQRRLLDAARDAGEDDVQEMVEVIPGLFDF